MSCEWVVMRRVNGRNLVRVSVVLLLAAAGAALIGADMVGGERGGVPRAAAWDADLQPRQLWEGEMDPSAAGTVSTAEFEEAVNTLFDGQDHSWLGRLNYDVRWPALARAGVLRETRVTLVGGPVTHRQRVEAALASADRSGRLVCVREGWRVTITTREDLEAGVAMGAERAGASGAVRAVLNAPVTYSNFYGMTAAEILRQVTRAYGIRIDADWERLSAIEEEEPGKLEFIDADVGGVIEHVLRRCGGRYRVVDGGIRVVLIGGRP